jgi:integrase
VQQDTWDAVKVLMDESKHNRDSVIFDKGSNVEQPYNMWTKRLNVFLRRQKMKGITTHDFRKTTATNLYRKTGKILAVQRLLNHKSIETTKLYIDIDQDQLGKDMNQMMKRRAH